MMPRVRPALRASRPTGPHPFCLAWKRLMSPRAGSALGRRTTAGVLPAEIKDRNTVHGHCCLLQVVGRAGSATGRPAARSSWGKMDLLKLCFCTES